MSMTRTDFKAIAECLREERLLYANADVYELAKRLCKYFKQSNPTFDRGKFMRDCGYYQEG